MARQPETIDWRTLLEGDSPEFRRAAEAVETFLERGIAPVMNRYNRREDTDDSPDSLLSPR